MKRRDRKWLEDGQIVTLAKHPNGTPTPVEVCGIVGDSGGEVIYRVREVADRAQVYPASERHLTAQAKEKRCP